MVFKIFRIYGPRTIWCTRKVAKNLMLFDSSKKNLVSANWNASQKNSLLVFFYIFFHAKGLSQQTGRIDGVLFSSGLSHFQEVTKRKISR